MKMLDILFVLGFTMNSSSVFAAEKCLNNALRAVQAVYNVNVASVQGAGVDAEFLSAKDVADGERLLKFEFADGNDDGDSWISTMTVLVFKDGCHVKQVTETNID